MKWLARRARMLLFAVIVFLALAVLAIGILRVVSPGLNLLEMIGLAEDETQTVSRTRPYWTELTAEQKQSLAPLEAVWDTIASSRKKKWLEIAQHMASLPSQEKARVQERIQIWVNLTPEERREARQNYLNARKLGVRNKALHWLEYQSLPEEEKKELAENARKKRRIVNPPPQVKRPDTVLPEAEKETKPPAKEESPDYWR